MKLMFKLLALLLVLLLFVCGALFYVVFVPKTSATLPVQVRIEHADTIHSIAAKLTAHDLIGSPKAFSLLARATGQDRKIRSGDYQIKDHLSLWDLLKKLQTGEARSFPIRIIEGWTFRQMRQMLRNHHALKHDTEHLSDAELLRELQIDYPHPEGLFFPDTYFVSQGTSERSIYQRAHDKLQQELARAWEAKSPNLPYKNPYDLLIMASIVEKETAFEPDRSKIAQVFINRLNLGMRLQTDPTVIYGVGEAFDGNLTRKHLRTDTPYNTYTRAGLPPTPIALVGRASLDAAIFPSETKALYFVARGDGSSQFSDTLAQHNAAVKKYILKK